MTHFLARYRKSFSSFGLQWPSPFCPHFFGRVTWPFLSTQGRSMWPSEMLASSIVISHLMFNPAQCTKKFRGKHWKTITIGLCVQQMEKACYFCVQLVISMLCPTLCDPMDYSPPGSSVHGIFQARRLEWVAIPFSRGSFRPGDQIQFSCSAGGFFTIWATRETQPNLGQFIKYWPYQKAWL